MNSIQEKDPSAEGAPRKGGSMELMFGQLPVGTVFTYRGEVYRKIALSMAQDEKGWGSIFQGEMAVKAEVETAALLQWKPDEVAWFDRLSPAPGQRDR